MHCVAAAVLGTAGDSREKSLDEKKTLLRLMGNGEKTERAGKKTFLLHLKVREISDVLCSALQALLLPKVAASMCRM